MSKSDSDDVAKGIAWLMVGVVVLIAIIPKPFWILLGVLAGTAVLIVFTVWVVNAYTEHRAAVDERKQKERAARAAAANREREERARREKQRRIETLGNKNAALVESALAAVEEVRASEAAREGWLGDVDFTADVQRITVNFTKAYSLRRVIGELSALDNPSADDRKILADARTTAAELERTASEGVELIGQCADEASRIDESLSQERKDARTAEQRAELHGKLSAMLYGIEATPDRTPTSAAADAVLARVQAYRDIKNRIQEVRDG
ncbi:hypothetical protein [Mycolicibacterium thermoresistibile]